MADSPHYDIRDERFRSLIVGSAALEELYRGCRWAEGPVWFSDLDCLIWSDIPNQRMMRWTPDGGASVFRSPSNYVNGNTRDRQGCLISCEHGGRRVTRTEHDGRITVLADSYEGKRLNSPNDAVVHSDGTIWFTDPTYGILSDYEGHKAEPEQPTRNVYRTTLYPAQSRPSSAISSSRTGSPSRRTRRGFTLPTRDLQSTRFRGISAFSTSPLTASSQTAAISVPSTTAIPTGSVSM